MPGATVAPPAEFISTETVSRSTEPGAAIVVVVVVSTGLFAVVDSRL